MTHHHHHHPVPESDEQAGPVDPAMKSLSDALQVSFRLLGIVMLLFVVLFLYTGFGTIQANQMGIVKVFGQVTRVVGEGYVFNWPYPVGQIEIVETQERRLEIDHFWMHETAADKTRPLAERSRQNNGLRPGWDGYLLTGDRNFIHMQFVCTYRVQNPVAVESNVQDLENVLRTELARAAIRSAAIRTADAMQLDPTPFLQDVQQTAQRSLNRLLGGDPDGLAPVRLTSVVLPPREAKIWPLAAYGAYEAAQNAKSEKQRRIDTAIAEAKQTLISAVGAKHFAELVGQPWISAALHRRRTRDGRWDNQAYNLIGQYNDLEEQLQLARDEATPDQGRIDQLQKRMQAIRAQIDDVLTQTTIGGQTSEVIAQAESLKTRTIQNAERRARRFDQLVAEYDKAPQVLLEKLWSDTLDDVLSQPTAIKWFLKPGQSGMVIHLNTSPQILRQIRNFRRKQQREASQRP
jgi:regulator of protease activity HflC (stomatin/prohibitin superfamily)